MKKLIARMNALANTNKLELSVASSMLTVTAERIFEYGKAADGQPLGNYSESYVSIRKKTSWGGNPKIILQGVDRSPKGTRGNPNKRGTTSYKATGQMANDFSVISTGTELGLGFKNSANADKSEYVEETYKKDIFKHTPKERKLLDELIEKELKKWLSGR